MRVREILVLGYNKYGEGHIADLSYGQITVSVVFRPIASVERSGWYIITVKPVLSGH